MATRSIKKNYTFNLIARIITLIVPLVVTPYISRRIGADGVGLCSFIASIASYFVLVANLGISSYALREISMHRDDENYIKKFAVEVALVKCMLTLLCAAVYCAVFVRASGTAENFVYILYIVTVVEVMLDFSWYFQGIERFGILAILNVLSKVVYIILIFVFVNGVEDLIAYAAITVFSGTLIPVCGTICMFKLCKGKVVGKLNVFKHFKPCMVYFLPAIASQIYTVVDKTMIGAITKSNAENGYYEFTERIAKLPLTLLTSMNAIMESRIALYYAQGNMDAAKALTVKSINFSMMVALPSTAGLIAVAKTFIPIYLGSGYEQCITLTYIFAPLVTVIAFSNLLGSHYYTPFGMRIKSAIFLVCGAVVNVILNSFMIYSFKSVGAAIASIAAEGVISVLYIVFARKFIKPVLFAKVAVKYLISAAVMGVAVFFMNLYLPASLKWLVVEVVAGVAMYVLMLVVLRTEYFTVTVKSILSRVFPKRTPAPAAVASNADSTTVNDVHQEGDRLSQMNEPNTGEEIRCGFSVTQKRKAVWAKELELVQEFVRICDKHELTYFLAGGTLLGAIRHGGFIPWDDDIDIMMSRNNYEKFLAVCHDELKSEYFLQHYTTEKNYANGHIQIRDSSTTALLRGDYNNLKMKKNLGIFIDIFPFDNIPNDRAAAQKFTAKIKRKKRLANAKINSRKFRGIKGILKKAYLAVFARNTAKLIADIDRSAQRFNGKTDRVAFNTFMPGYERNMWDISWFDECIKVPFEHLMLNAPKEYDKVLRTEYGDYTVIPDDKGGTMHGSCYFDTEKSYTQYLDVSEEEFNKLFEDMQL